MRILLSTTASVRFALQWCLGKKENLITREIQGRITSGVHIGTGQTELDITGYDLSCNNVVYYCIDHPGPTPI